MNFYEFIVKVVQSFVNDKVLVIAAVCGITVLCIVLKVDSVDTIVTSAFTGLFGIAVGRAMARAGDNLPANPNGPIPNGGAK